MRSTRAHAFANAIVAGVPDRERHSRRELVITVALPEDRGRRGDARPKVHRFRSHWLELGQRLRAIREQHGLTQAEVAAAIGTLSKTSVTQWEAGTKVPDGLRRERVVALLESRLWPELRAAVVTGPGVPPRWAEAVRWYRRASRERRPRGTLGRAIAALLDELRAVVWPEDLRNAYCARDGDWARAIAVRQRLGEEHLAEMRRLEDAAFGLRWFELTHGVQYDLRRSLVPQVHPAMLAAEPSGCLDWTDPGRVEARGPRPGARAPCPA